MEGEERCRPQGKRASSPACTAQTVNTVWKSDSLAATNSPPAPATEGQSTGHLCEAKTVATSPLIVGGDSVRRIAQQEPQETVEVWLWSIVRYPSQLIDYPLPGRISIIGQAVRADYDERDGGTIRRQRPSLVQNRYGLFPGLLRRGCYPDQGQGAHSPGDQIGLLSNQVLRGCVVSD